MAPTPKGNQHKALFTWHPPKFVPGSVVSMDSVAPPPDMVVTREGTGTRKTVSGVPVSP